jgi:hypothetical protein
MTSEVLSVLDSCCDSFTFPMLDNGYVYLAATRLALYKSPEDWAVVIEVFGYSPREGVPSTAITTFASRLSDRDKPENYVSREAYENYLRNNPHNEFRLVHPLDDSWIGDDERVDVAARSVLLRGVPVAIPERDAYREHGIDLEGDGHVQVFELARYLAAIARDEVLAMPSEQRMSIRPEMRKVLQVEEWHHPNVVDDEKPSASETFQQLAEVLRTGDASRYRPTLAPNTHWRNWPDGGLL